MSRIGTDPVLDIARLADVGRLNLDRHRPDPALDAIVERAARETGTPWAFLAAVLSDTEAFLSLYGLPDAYRQLGGVPLEWTFCQHTIRLGTPLLVPDAQRSEPYRSLVSVTALGVGSYAGVPLISSRGHAVGTLCVLAPGPRDFTGPRLRTLLGLAAEAMDALEPDTH